MKIRWNGIEWSNGDFVYWFDPAEVKTYRSLGYEVWNFDGVPETWICFWFFNIGWRFE